VNGIATVREEDGSLAPPGTYFVLRSGDRFSYAALWAYSQAMATALELGSLPPDERASLVERAAEIEEMAATWQAQTLSGRRDDA
jgi:hypothetical protein